MKIKRLYRAVTSLTVEYLQTCEFAHLFKADLKKKHFSRLTAMKECFIVQLSLFGLLLLCMYVSS